MFPNPRLLKLAQKSRFWLILTICLGFISGLLVLGQARTISQIVSQVFLDGSGLNEVSNLLLLTLGFFTLRGALAWLSSLSGKTISVQVKSWVRDLLIQKLRELGPAYLKGEQSGELNRTLVEGVEALDAYFSQYLPQLVLSALVPITILVFVFPMDTLSGFVLLVTAPLIPYFMYLIGSSAKSITDRQYSTLSRLAAHFLDSLQGLTTLRLFNRADDQVEKIRETSDQYRTTTMKVLRVTFLSALVLELLATLSTAVVAVEIGLRLLYFKVSLEQALFLLMIAPEFYVPLRMLGLRFHAGMEGQSAAERIFDILDTQPFRSDIKNPPNEELSLPMEVLKCKEVCFTYPGENQPALDGVDFQINHGEQIALVGESGSGKSTLAKLIMGFFPPGKGKILVNGTSLSQNNLEEWREQIAWVSQETALFQDTIAANIRLASPNADQSAVASAASAAHLAGFIESLPAGYDTLIGEGGGRLSGGQAQRLALARAFLKNAPILLLDEPTSQLDPDTESQLADATAKLMVGRTVITIAHRLNTIYKADRILVLKNGKIVQWGSHRELLEYDGEYKRLVLAYTGSDDIKVNDVDHNLDPPPAPTLKKDISPTKPLNSEDTIKSDQSTFKRLLSFFKPHWKEVLLSVFLGFLTIGSSVGLMGASAWLISMAALHPNIAVLQVAIVGVRFFGITRGVSRYFERLVSHNLTFKILTRLRIWFFRSLIPLTPARTLKYKAGDLLGRIVSDIKTLEDFYVRSLAPPLVAILIGLGTTIFLMPYNIQLALITGGMYLISMIGLPLISAKLAKEPGQKMVRIRADFSGLLINFIQGLPDLLAFGAVEKKYRELVEKDRGYQNAQLGLARISGINGFLSIFLSNLAMWTVLILAIPLVNSGELPGVMLAALALLVLSSYEAVNPLPLAMETFSSSMSAGRRLFEILEGEPDTIDRRPGQPFPLPIHLEVQELSFSYPDDPQPVLDQVNFQINEGQKIALVGPSGAGKSTLTNLLLRFWSRYQGAIILGQNGLELDEVQQEVIRKNISVVSQSSYLFNDSVYNNLKLGKAGASRDEIIQAAQAARIHRKIESLPDGYETYISERGLNFSAGERQRIAIARAVLKDAPIFILDEPTANLDPITEKEVINTLFGVLKEKTVLLITHRLVNLDRVDHILVMDQGQIIERGTEAELLTQSGLYHRMYTLQNRLLRY